MTVSGYIALGVILLMIVALVREMLRPGLILFSALVIFLAADILTAEEALSGFSNKGMITVALLFLVSEGEKESGVTDKGSVDLIWINGENFRTMKQAELVFCGYLESLPNNQLVDWENPAIANDFGVAGA